MNATKRKFTAILQGIGARPSSASSATDPTSIDALSDPTLVDAEQHATGSSAMAGDLEFLVKRRRITAPSSTAPPRNNAAANNPLPPRAGETTISNVVLRKWTPDKAARGRDVSSTTTTTATATATATATSNEPPKYCPGDRAQLLRRLATFQELTDWTPKPDRVSEIEWAKKGWVCQGKERVRCVLCSKELVVRLNKREVDGQEVSVLVASEIEDALVEKYVELMVTSHQEDCLWMRRGCDDSLLRIPITNPKAVHSDLRQRYDELCARKDFLPYEFNLRLPPELDVDKILSYLPPNFFTEPPQPATTTGTNTTTSTSQAGPPHRAALALAVMGWQGLSNARIGPVPNSASCHTCLRRLGLWMFKSKEVEPATNAVLVPALMDHLDPLREHRFFCPWKDGVAQHTTSAKRQDAEPPRPAWELLVELLKNEAHLRNRAAAGHGRSKSSVSSGKTLTAASAGTPARPTTSAGTGAGGNGTSPPIVVLGPDGGEAEGGDDAATRDAKDKERWARLRKVKSFFNTKDGKKLRRGGGSRPGTSHSSVRGGE